MRGIMRIILRDVKVTAGPLEINSRQLTWQSQRAQRAQEAGQRREDGEEGGVFLTETQASVLRTHTRVGRVILTSNNSD